MSAMLQVSRFNFHPTRVQFINLLTKDKEIRIGHDLESQTIDINVASYTMNGRRNTLVDTPGFDDSRQGVTDTDILGKIANFLQEK